MVNQLVTEEIPNSELVIFLFQINGIRFIEKSRKLEVFYRVDVWLNTTKDTDENIRKHN